METTTKEITFSVPDISCQHCINAITKETQAVGVDTVQVDITSKQVYVSFDTAKVSEEQVKGAIDEAGYDIAGQQTGNLITAGGSINKQSLNFTKK